MSATTNTPRPAPAPATDDSDVVHRFVRLVDKLSVETVNQILEGLTEEALAKVLRTDEFHMLVSPICHDNQEMATAVWRWVEVAGVVNEAYEKMVEVLFRESVPGDAARIRLFKWLRDQDFNPTPIEEYFGISDCVAEEIRGILDAVDGC